MRYLDRRLEKEILEAKAARAVKPEMAVPLNRLVRAISRYKTEKYVVYLDPPKSSKTVFHGLGPGVKAIPVGEIGKRL